MSDKKGGRNSCQTKNSGRPRVYEGASERVSFRMRRGTEHDEVFEILDALPNRAKSAWVVQALLCYVRGDVRNVEREAQVMSEELEADLFGMWED